jgi:hypothetical protein
MSNEISFEDLHELPPAEDCKASTNQHTTDIGGVEVPGFVEDCPKCNGTGTWRGGYSRYGRECFKCKGEGKLAFKTSPEARAKGRASAKRAKGRKEELNRAAWAEFLEANPAVADWFKIKLAAGNGFAMNLNGSAIKYGGLTEGQLGAVMNSIADMDDTRHGFEQWCEGHPGILEWLNAEVEKGNEFAGSCLDYGLRNGKLSDGQYRAVQNNLDSVAQEAKGGSLDISELKGYYAVPDGDTRLKICVRKPGKNSRWLGWTFVDDGAAYGCRKTYGKQAPDGLYKGDIQDQLKAILADPFEAQVAYGKLTGTCGTCGRILEDEESVAAGIGPICAAKFG